MKKSENKNLLLWPDLAIIEFLTAITLTIILVIWALLINVPLLEIVSPGISENPSNAPWYSVGLQELLVYFDPWIAGVIIPGLIIACLMFIPYLGSRSGGSGEASVTLRKFALINFNLGFLMWLLLIFAGYFLRGAERLFYRPWESWEPLKIQGNLWSPDPLAGLLGIVVYAGAGMIIPRLACPGFYRKCRFRRYVIVMILMLLMYAVPIKIFLRLVFNIKYVLVTPWFNI